MDRAYETLLERGEQLFTDKQSLNSLHQEIADHFYVERADFTRRRYLGQDFASHLTSSYPLIVRRDLGNAISSILRPSELDWVRVTVEDHDKLDKAGKEWLEHKTKVMRRIMYDRDSNFVRATKEGDHDFATFGQCVLSIEYNPRAVALLYRCWHLRDCAWQEGSDGKISELHIRWNPRISELVSLFGLEKMHSTVQSVATDEPNRKITCRRVIIRADDLQVPGQKWRYPWVIAYIDVENKHLMGTVNSRTRGHIIPRWVTVSGSQYAYSPAAVAGLPDARLIQAMTLTLLEAGEMAVRPPMLQSGDHIREDINNFAGGITYVTGDYDKKKIDILRPLYQDKSGLPFGLDISDDIAGMLTSAFYLNKLTLPPPGDGEMTAYEASERIKEYIRSARPLFEPMEHEYNYELCDMTWEESQIRGAFGSVEDMPESLMGRETKYDFESPLHEAVERQKGVTFLEAKQMTREAFDLDPAAAAVLDARKALRDALGAVRTPEEWLRDEQDVEEMAEQMAADQAVQQEAANVQQAAEAAATMRETM